MKPHPTRRLLAACALASLTLPASSAEIELVPDADAFIDSGQKPNSTFVAGDSKTLNIKSLGETTAGSRKAFLRFDVSVLGGKAISGAKLVLTANSLEWGTDETALEFRLYGLKRDATAADGILGADWDEYQIRWENAPANDLKKGNSVYDGSGTARSAEAEELLTATLVKPEDAAVGGLEQVRLVFEGSELTTFINHEPTGVITFIITRVGGASQSNSTFASRENDQHPGPLLTLTLKP